MRKQLLFTLAVVLPLTSCGLFGDKVVKLAERFQSAMEYICSFRPSLDTAVSVVKAYDLEVGVGAAVINQLAKKACEVVTSNSDHGGGNKGWFMTAPDGTVVKIEGDFVEPEPPAPE